MSNKLILIDGYGLVFRAFFSMKYIKNRSDGTPMGAVFGFTRILRNLISNIKYTHIAVAFDCGGKNFRHELYSEYKANRPKCPPELVPQFSIVREAVKAMNIVSLEKVGYEADDIIATYTDKAKKEDYVVEIISIDKDLMQLVDENVCLYNIFDDKIIKKEEVFEKFGVEPKQVADVLSLIGDISDNVQGVPHIGPKIAANLIKEFGSIENLIENVENIEKKRIRDLIKENMEGLKLAKKLVELNRDVFLDKNIDDFQYKGINENTFNDFLIKNELKHYFRDVLF